MTLDPAGTISGTSIGETLTGTAGVDVINGLAGGDILIGGGGADVIFTGEANDNVQDIIRLSAAGDYGDTINQFDANGADSLDDQIQFTDALDTLFDDIGASNDTLTWASGNDAAGTVAANITTTVEALFLSGQAGEGVTNAALTDPTQVAAAFNAEFVITAVNGNDALLVVNDTNANSASIWQYTESTGGGKISAAELTFVALVNSNAAIATGNLDLAA